MRSHEFIAEAITIADYQEQFEKVIVASIKVALINLTDDRGILKQTEEKANQIDSIVPLITGYMSRFWIELRNAIKDNLSEIVAKLFNQRYKNTQLSIDVRSNIIIKFKDIGYYGYADGLSIILNNEFISDIDYAVRRIIQDNYLDLIDYKENNTATDKFFKAIKELASHPNIILDDYKIIDIIFGLSSTVTHELVHVFQHAEQYKKGRFDTEYRSYAEKDKDKFYAAVRRLGAPEDSSLEDFKMSLASPQEITAISHNIANNIIKDFNLDQNPNYIDQDHFNAIISSYVLDQLQYTPEQRKNTNYIDRKVFNRYAKQVYQILQHYLEKKNEKSKIN